MQPDPAQSQDTSELDRSTDSSSARGYSSDFGCVYTFTPLLNETGRICLKTTHVAATKAGALIMRVPFRSAYRRAGVQACRRAGV